GHGDEHLHLPARVLPAHDRDPRDGARALLPAGPGRVLPRRPLVRGAGGRLHLGGALLPAIVLRHLLHSRAVPLPQERASRRGALMPANRPPRGRRPAASRSSTRGRAATPAPRARAAPRSIGVSVPKLEGFDKVTGRARYIDDLRVPGILHGRTVR